MAYTPYDWNQSIQTRMEYIEERLREGSPVVGLSLPEGVLLLSVHRAQRKLYELYDRLAFGGIGNQSDVETMRNVAIDFAHREGFSRSPDDVTIYRLVGSVLSPALKRAFGDPFTAPFVFRGLYAELGDQPEHDTFYTLGFDGEFRSETRYTVIAGSFDAENRMIDLLHAGLESATDRNEALDLALRAWGTGRLQARAAAHRSPAGVGRRDEPDDPSHEESLTLEQVLREEISEGQVEAALLERGTARESKFRLLRAEELRPAVERYR
jgi:proteasome alpha subunit